MPIITKFGYATLLLSLVIAIFIICYNLLNFYQNRKKSTDKFNYRINITNLFSVNLSLSVLLVVLSIISQIVLIIAYIRSDNLILNVYNNSHHLKPLIYKIAGSWGNHEGSMLLLITVISCYNLAFLIFSDVTKYFKVITSSSLVAIIAIFLAFTFFTSNPFAPNLALIDHPNLAISAEGLGLNPILQDIGLAMHPPMLYIGYLGFVVIFSIAIAIMISGKITQLSLRSIEIWLYFTTSFLTAGIALGSWWAYRELGWGGYWFWDPVENISLMPWLIAITIIHCIKIVRKYRLMANWLVFLAILNFIFCLIGIFLTRSGVLTSVHSFAVDAKRGLFILWMITGIGFLSMLIFALRINNIKLLITNNQHNITNLIKIDNNRSRLLILFSNNYLLLIALFVVFLGTIYPLISQLIFEQFITIGSSYYNLIFKLLLIPFTASLIIFYIIDSKNNYKNQYSGNILHKIFTDKFNITALISSLTITIYLIQHYQSDYLIIILCFLVLYCFILAIINMMKHYKNIRKMASNIAHTGFLLLIIAIIISSIASSSKEVNLKIGESFDIANFHIKFEKINHYQDSNFITREGVFAISKKIPQKETNLITKSDNNNQSKAIFYLYPQLRYYPISQQITNESSIKIVNFADLYLIIGQKDEQDFYAIRAYYKPFICFIWLAMITITSSLLLSFSIKFKNILK
jgi:cytochrome c-type biogenesis protein CcmF